MRVLALEATSRRTCRSLSCREHHAPVAAVATRAAVSCTARISGVAPLLTAGTSERPVTARAPPRIAAGCWLRPSLPPRRFPRGKVRWNGNNRRTVVLSRPRARPDRRPRARPLVSSEARSPACTVSRLDPVKSSRRIEPTGWWAEASLSSALPQVAANILHTGRSSSEAKIGATAGTLVGGAAVAVGLWRVTNAYFPRQRRARSRVEALTRPQSREKRRAPRLRCGPELARLRGRAEVAAPWPAPALRCPAGEPGPTRRSPSARRTVGRGYSAAIALTRSTPAYARGTP